MDIQFEETDDALVIHPQADRIDAFFVATFRDAILHRSAGRSKIVVDLRQVRYMDSTGLGCLVSVRRALPQGGFVRLVHTSPTVGTLLQLTHMDKVFPLYNSVSEALQD